ncbi:MAG: hypothetical protein SCH71_06720 [Desulfobulbaceae bacterium]|nr:hypothetical protein [Desulfobulbaceae bacterium]
MKRHSALLFPDTVPDEQVLYPLVPVFQPLVYCRPVESEPLPAGECSPLCAEFFHEAFWQQVVPAPLGPERERFQRLVSDLRQRGDDYAAQLTHLSLAGMGSSAKGTETKGSILSALLGSHGIQQDRRDGREMVLWQSRLILMLGEFFDENQRQLSGEMKKIRDREKGILDELRRESEYSYTLTQQLFTGSAEEGDQQRLRLSAWARIFALGEDSPENCRVFITGNNDAYERLAEVYERDCGNFPEQVVSLPLPAGAGEVERPLAHLQKFSAEAEDYIARLSMLIDGSNREPVLPAAEEAWEHQLERYFPAADCGRKVLRLCRFDRVSVRRLFLDGFGHDDDKKLLEPNPAAADIFIGVLSAR